MSVAVRLQERMAPAGASIVSESTNLDSTTLGGVSDGMVASLH